MKLAVSLLICAPLTLAACAKPTPPQQVGMQDGKPVFQIYTSMQANAEPTDEELAAMSQSLQGPGRGNLADRAAAQCPSGYDIVDQTEPQARFTMTLANGLPLYRVSQSFSIACR